jgi:DNA end-binding protein Ku
MARAIWSGTISFGLVSIPVKLYSAVQRKAVRFNQLDSDGLDRIQQQRVNARTGAEVPYERIVKGYEVTPDRYVVVEPRELDALDPRRTREISLEGFVDAAEIPPIFYDATYYVVPAEGGAKPYRLLIAAMTASDKVAIARFVLRSKEYLVALRPAGDVLELSTMIFADEIADATALDELAAVLDVEVGDRELAMAEQLIGSLTEPFDAAKYRDEYRERVLELIERKAQGEQIDVAAVPEAAAAPVPDLMAALKASLDAAKAADAKPAVKKRKPAAKPAAARSKTPGRAAGKR